MPDPTKRLQDTTLPVRLIVFCGRPGTGKTTLATAVARALPACYLRVDAAETALKRTGMAVGTEGYAVVHELAVSNLQLGHDVVVDAANPVPQSRAGWSEATARARAQLLMVETLLPDVKEHRRRVEQRSADIPGHLVPTWEQIVNSEWTPWVEERDGQRLQIDSTHADTALARILQALRVD
ncbi:ATP-binding protein [Nostocoides sp. F2B08]|uniref:AAA family ATPase n=1 Tax=Nostocoides sp. F2B08 TaxID=2653936 RepID=UPI00186B138D|nr:ATP-binding protein [Tetrasphaera sp. F2B08]